MKSTASPIDGSHLARYAGCFSAVEINSSFYQVHRPETYARWAASVPAGFRFSVKFPKVITHERRLKNVRKMLTPFIESVTELGDKLGALLLQLPPSFEFERRRATAFFKLLRSMHMGTVVLEPRHATWFHAKAVDLCKAFGIGYVVADPAPVEGADALEAWTDIVYFRLHGSPRMYFSSVLGRISRIAGGQARRDRGARTSGVVHIRQYGHGNRYRQCVRPGG